MAEIIAKEPVEIYAEPEPTPLDIAKAKGGQRREMQTKIDILKKVTIVSVESRLAKIESTDTVKAELIAKEEPIISK